MYVPAKRVIPLSSEISLSEEQKTLIIALILGQGGPQLPMEFKGTYWRLRYITSSHKSKRIIPLLLSILKNLCESIITVKDYNLDSSGFATKVFQNLDFLLNIFYSKTEPICKQIPPNIAEFLTPHVLFFIMILNHVNVFNPKKPFLKILINHLNAESKINLRKAFQLRYAANSTIIYETCAHIEFLTFSNDNFLKLWKAAKLFTDL
jgi:LAGLIDADG DNA endonuclease family